MSTSPASGRIHSLEADRAGRQRRGEACAARPRPCPGCVGRAKTARQHHEDRRRRVDAALGHHLAAAEGRGDAKPVAVGLNCLAAGHQRGVEPRGKQRRQVPADRRGADQHGPRLLPPRPLPASAARIRLRRVGGQLRIVDHHDAIGRAQRRRVGGAVGAEHQRHDLPAGRPRPVPGPRPAVPSVTSASASRWISARTRTSCALISPVLSRRESRRCGRRLPPPSRRASRPGFPTPADTAGRSTPAARRGDGRRPDSSNCVDFIAARMRLTGT